MTPREELAALAEVLDDPDVAEPQLDPREPGAGMRGVVAALSVIAASGGALLLARRAGLDELDQIALAVPSAMLCAWLWLLLGALGDAGIAEAFVDTARALGRRKERGR